MEDVVLISFKEYSLRFRRSIKFADLDENSSKIRKNTFSCTFLLLLKDPCFHRMIRKIPVVVKSLSTYFSSSSLCGQSPFVQICWISTVHYKRYV